MHLISLTPGNALVRQWLLPLMLVVGPATHALAWPTQALTLVVGFSKGSTSEVVASTIAEPLSKRLGQSVVVDIVTGKAGTNAAAKVAQASDGHTFGIVVNNALTVAPAVDPQLAYNPEKDLRPLAFLTDDAMVLVASTKESSASAADFLLAARNAGAQWKYGSQGVGSIGQLGMELLGVKSNARPSHVPLAGGPEVAEAIKAGQIQMALLPATLAKKFSAPGQGLKMVAVTSREPYAALPGVPSLHQSGVVGFDFRVWSSAIAPKSMPEANAERLAKDIATVINSPEVVQQLAKSGLTVAKDTSAGQAKREIAYETKVLSGIVLMRGIKLETKP